MLIICRCLTDCRLLKCYGCISVLGLGDGGERATAREWLFLGSSLALVILLCVVKVVAAASGGGKIMHMVRWKRLLLRGLVLLAVGFMAFSCFLALEAVAGKLLGEEGSSVSSFSLVRAGCAVVAAATHFQFGRALVAGV